MARRTAPKLIERRRVCFGGIPLDTPPLAAGSFISIPLTYSSANMSPFLLMAGWAKLLPACRHPPVFIIEKYMAMG